MYLKNGKPERTKEICIIAIGIIIIVIGCVCDCLTRIISPSFEISGYDNICLTAFGAQATVVTLFIAFIALLGNKTSETYYGINSIAFILSIKPKLFSFSITFIIQITLLLLNLVFIITSFYNASISIFIASLLILSYPSNTIFKAYENTYDIKSEIAEYIKQSSENKQKLELLITPLYKGWRIIIENQRYEEFIEYTQIMTTVMSEILQSENKALIKNATDMVKDLCITCFIRETNECIMRAIYILRQMYNLNENTSTELFIGIAPDLIARVKKLSQDDINMYGWQEFLSKIIIISRKNQDTHTTNTLRKLIFSLACESQEYDQSEVTAFAQWLINDIHRQTTSDDILHSSIMAFAYIIGLLHAENSEILDYVLINNLKKGKNRTYVGKLPLLIISLYCYGYYAQSIEQEDNIPDGLDVTLQEFFDSSDTKMYLQHFFKDYFFTPDKTHLYSLLQDVKLLIQPYSLRDRNGFATNNTGKVADDFILLSMVMQQRYSSQTQNIFSDVDNMTLISFFNKLNMNDFICNYLKYLPHDPDFQFSFNPKKKMENKIEAFHNLAKDYISTVLVEREKNKNNLDKAKITNDLRNVIFALRDNQLRILTSGTQAAMTSQEISLQCFDSISDITSYSEKELEKILLPILVCEIRKLLSANNNIRTISTDDLNREEDFDKIKTSDFKLTIGSGINYFLIKKAFRTEFKSLIEKCNKILIESLEDFLILLRKDAFSMNIKDVKVRFDALSKEDIECKYNAAAGLYEIVLRGNIPVALSEAELQDYIESVFVKFVITLSLDIYISDEENIGVAIINGDKL